MASKMSVSKPPILLVVLTFIAQGISGAVGGVAGFYLIGALYLRNAGPMDGWEGLGMTAAGCFYGFPTGFFLGLVTPGVLFLRFMRQSRKLLPAIGGMVIGTLLGPPFWLLIGLLIFPVPLRIEILMPFVSALGFMVLALRGWDAAKDIEHVRLSDIPTIDAKLSND
jgi:hypothetical protein